MAKPRKHLYRDSGTRKIKKAAVIRELMTTSMTVTSGCEWLKVGWEGWGKKFRTSAKMAYGTPTLNHP